MDLHEKTSHLLGAALASNLDALLREAISRALGRTDWALAELEGRLYQVTDPKTRTETYFVDTAPVLVVYPVDTEIAHNGMSHTITAHRPYRFLIEEPFV